MLDATQPRMWDNLRYGTGPMCRLLYAERTRFCTGSEGTSRIGQLRPAEEEEVSIRLHGRNDALLAAGGLLISGFYDRIATLTQADTIGNLADKICPSGLQKSQIDP